MSEEKKPFTVKDRRQFTPEGAKREAEAPPAAPPEAPHQPEPSRVDEAHAASGVDSELPSTGEAPFASPDDDRRGRFPNDFLSLLVTLGSQGSMLLAGVHPGEDEPGPPDLEGARDVISLLESLQTKTEGHRSADEDRLLGGLLYELRMAYVSLRKDNRT